MEQLGNRGAGFFGHNAPLPPAAVHGILHLVVTFVRTKTRHATFGAEAGQTVPLWIAGSRLKNKGKSSGLSEDDSWVVHLLLMHARLKAVPSGPAQLIVGDVDQLSGQAGFLPMSSPPGRCRWCASPRCSARQRRAGSSSTPIASTRARCPNSVNS